MPSAGKHSLNFHSDLRLERLITHVGSIPNEGESHESQF
jgi:hypothetical protein